MESPVETMSEQVCEAKVKVPNPHGIHLRPADLFVRTAIRFSSKVRVGYDGQAVDGKSIVDMLMLAARQGTELSITATGGDAAEAVAALVELVNGGFGEFEGTDTGKATT